MNKKLLLGLLLGTALSAFAQENLATWGKYKTITVNTKATGANVAASVANFPVLVRLDSVNAADVFAQALPAGADIRFATAAGAPRPYQIEEWNATTKRAAIWVLADTVKGNDSVATLRIYWSKAGAADSSKGRAVFDSANGWRAVYHMNGGTSATEADATIHGLNMSASDSVAGSIPGDTVGMVGRARTFVGDSTSVTGRQYFVAPNSAANAAVDATTNTAHTISSWVYARAISTIGGHGNSIFNKGDRQYAFQIYGSSATSTAKRWESAQYTSTWRQIPSKSATPAAVGAWYHITGTWSGGPNATNGTAQLYVNGVLDSSATTLGIGTTAPTRTFNLFIGANPNAGQTGTAPGTTRSLAGGTLSPPRFWNGYIDEVTFSRTVRSADFVKLSYETQKSTANAVTLGTTQTQTQTPVALSNLRYVPTNTAALDTILNLNTGVPVNLVPTITGGPVDSFVLISGTIPAGLTLNKFTGAVSGTPTTVTAAGNRVIRAIGHFAANDTASRTLRLSVVLGPTMGLTYAQDTVVYATGLSYSNSPSYSGRAPTLFGITPALPTGLKIDSISGVISGSPSVAVAAANYTVKGSNATDTVTKVLRITTVAAGSEDYTTWTGSKQIWLNTQGNGANVPTRSLKFPVLVRMDSASGFNAMFTAALAGGADLRFTKGAPTGTPGARLSHQIERWDATAKKAEVWVLMDTVPGNGIATLTARWGKAGAPSLSNGPSVFDTANGYHAVWHMSAGGTGNELDASINGYTMVAFNTPADAAGIIGRGRDLNGTNQRFQALNTASSTLNLQMTENYTLSAWFRPDSISTTGNDGHKIIDKGDNQYVLAIYDNATPKFWEITTRGNNTYMQARTDGASGPRIITGDSAVGSWHLLTGTYQGGAVGVAIAESLFYDGALVAWYGASNENTTGRNLTYNVGIGAQQAGTAPLGTTFTRFFNGLLDEIRIQKVARGIGWNKLEFENQRAAQTLVAFTAPVSIDSRHAASFAASGSFSVKPAGQGLTFQFQGAQDGRAILAMTDMSGRLVWSGAFAHGATQLAWDGRAASGAGVSAGVYAVRLTVFDKQGKVVNVLDKKVPLTR